MSLKVLLELVKRQILDFKFLATFVITCALMLGIGSIALQQSELTQNDVLDTAFNQEQFKNFTPFFLIYMLLVFMPLLIFITYGTDQFDKINNHYYRFLITRMNRSKIYFTFLSSQIIVHTIVLTLSFLITQFLTLQLYVDHDVLIQYTIFDLYIMPIFILIFFSICFITLYHAINNHNLTKSYSLFLIAFSVVIIFALPLIEPLTNLSLYANIPEFDERSTNAAIISILTSVIYSLLFTGIGYKLFMRVEL